MCLCFGSCAFFWSWFVNLGRVATFPSEQLGDVVPLLGGWCPGFGCAAVSIHRLQPRIPASPVPKPASAHMWECETRIRRGWGWRNRRLKHRRVLGQAEHCQCSPTKQQHKVQLPGCKQNLWSQDVHVHPLGTGVLAGSSGSGSRSLQWGQSPLALRAWE